MKKHKHNWECIEANKLYWCSVCGTLRETGYVDPEVISEDSLYGKTIEYRSKLKYKKPKIIKSLNNWWKD